MLLIVVVFIHVLWGLSGVCLPVSLQFGNGTLRLTTRQAYQLHGVLKEDLKTVFSSVVKNMGSTLGACGDVNRNVMGPAGQSVGCRGLQQQS